MIELVLVVVILGLISAIALPRFSQAADRARATALAGTLRALNSAAELYAAEHEGRTPAHEGSDVTVLGSALQRRLTMRTDIRGDFNAGDRIYGPYLRSMPVNPINGLRTVRIDGSTARSGVYGWRFDSAANAFTPDHLVAKPLEAQLDEDPETAVLAGD